MRHPVNRPLVAGALLSACAALLHVMMIAGGAEWYRFFGAGERMAVMAARGDLYPTVLTLAIASVLALWSAYALAGAGVVRALPLLKPALLLITAIYLVRALAFVPALLATGRPVTAFALWSSVICLGFGLVHLLGLVQRWRAL